MIQRRLLQLLSAALLVCTGCGGTGTGAAHPPQRPDAGPAPASPVTRIEAQRNTLQLKLPAWSRLAAGAEFEVTLSVSSVDELYQGSGRLAYATSLVQPVACSRGALLPAQNILSVKLDVAPGAATGLAGMDGIVPFAFSGMPGVPGCGRGAGELLRLRFKLLAQPGTRMPVQLVNSPEYLQLRGTTGQRLSFDLSTEVVEP